MHGTQTDSFFALPDPTTDISSIDDFLGLIRFPTTVQDRIYRPKTLVSPENPQRWRVKKIQFKNFSFSKTLIEAFEFEDCSFENCRFIATVFRRCRFSHCKFIQCNMYRAQFESVFIAPQSFAESFDEKLYANIGLHLYQELLNNSREQSQPDFTNDALYQFRRWQRFEMAYRPSPDSSRIRCFTRAFRWSKISMNRILEITTGYGTRLWRFLFTAVFIAMILSFSNLLFSQHLGLKIETITDSFYFTLITLTTIGFGDITPGTSIGRILVALQGTVGFILFATLASMIFRKLTP